MNKTQIKFAILPLALLFAVSIVSAYGVGAPYWTENPLKLSPGDSEIINLKLQNMVGDEDITLKAEIVEGNDIAELLDSDTTYTIPFGTKGYEVPLKITIPSDAKLGDEYKVSVYFKEIASAGGGEMLELATGVEKGIPIIVSTTSPAKTTSSSSGSSSIWMIVLIALAILVGYLLIRKKQQKTQTNFK
jgi:hypothetical protein